MPALNAPRSETRRLTARQETAGYAVRQLEGVKVRQSRRAWSGGTGKRGGPQTATVQVLGRVDMPPPLDVGRGEGRPSVLLLHSDGDMVASLLLRGEWCRHFNSDEDARAWAEREGWTVEATP